MWGLDGAFVSTPVRLPLDEHLYTGMSCMILEEHVWASMCRRASLVRPSSSACIFVLQPHAAEKEETNAKKRSRRVPDGKQRRVELAKRGGKERWQRDAPKTRRKEHGTRHVEHGTRAYTLRQTFEIGRRKEIGRKEDRQTFEIGRKEDIP